MRNLVRKARLVTLTGAGGAGKSRLAVQAARGLDRMFPDGMWLVELAALRESGDVASAIATVLGVREQPGLSITDVLLSAMASRGALLILDNCELLVEASAQICAVLLQRCPEARILATSREAIRMSGEVTWPVPPLPVPRPMRAPRAIPNDVSLLAGSDAVRLFVDRARAVEPGFRLTEGNASAVAEICRRLDGLPLAIELAAARVAALSPLEIAERLDRRFSVLTQGSRAGLPHHRTLQASVDWSDDLLTADEQVVARRAAVFAGGWTLTAAEAVCGEDATTGIVDRLARLVEHSLVIAEHTQDATRFRYLETIREYYLARLELAGESRSIQRRHRDYYLGLAERAAPHLESDGQERWLTILAVERENMRAALTTCMRDGDISTGLHLAGLLFRYWLFHDHSAEGHRWLTSFLALAQDCPPVEVVEAHVGAARLAHLRGDVSGAEAHIQRGLDMATSLGYEDGIAGALIQAGALACERLRPDLAEQDYRAAAALLAELNDPRRLGIALTGLSRVALMRDDTSAAQAYAEESLRIHVERGESVERGSALMCLGDATLERGRAHIARDHYVGVLDIACAVGDRTMMYLAIEGLAEIAASLRDTAVAVRHAEVAEQLRASVGGLADYRRRPRLVAALTEAGVQSPSAVDGQPIGDDLTHAASLALVHRLLQREQPSDDPRPAASPANGQLRLLTAREREVAAMIAGGLTSDEIASALSVAKRTVDTHADHIRAKLGFTSRLQLALWAARHGLSTGSSR